jgi:hypothetical protein
VLFENDKRASFLPAGEATFRYSTIEAAAEALAVRAALLRGASDRRGGPLDFRIVLSALLNVATSEFARSH